MSTKPAVKVIGTPKGHKEPTFDDIKEGEFFWNDNDLWFKTDEESAVKITDGYLFEEWCGEEICFLQKVEIKCVD